MAIINSMKNKKLGKKRIILLAQQGAMVTVIITYSLNPVLIKNWDINSPTKKKKKALHQKHYFKKTHNPMFKAALFTIGYYLEIT